MYSLRLFGGLSLEGADGPVTGRPAQHRRLAILALLAAQRTAMVSREKVVGYLWPDTHPERARHLLADSVYVLRKALGEDVVLSSNDDVGLNPDIVEADVRAFDEAIKQKDQAAATSLYVGPFLDGFHLKRAPEFEHWVDDQRRRFADRYAKALEDLAEDASRRGNLSQSAELWKKLAAHDAYDSRIALSLVNALSAAGDNAAAVRHAQRHEILLREELGVAPSPDLLDAIRELQRAPTDLQAVSTESHPAAPVAPDRIATDDDTVSGSAKPAVRRLRVSALAAAVILIAATAIGAVAIIRGVGADAAPESAISSASIAVLPFLNLSSDPEQEYFSDGLAEEISNVLAQIPDLHVTSRSSAFSFRGQAIEIPEVAARLGVAHVLEGSVQKIGTRVRITAQLIEAATDRHLWSKRFEREMELSDVFAIQDEISTAIVEALTATMGLETAPIVPERQVVGVEAYDVFLKGLKAFGEGTTDSRAAALSYFERVVALEPTYAAAHYQLARTYWDSRPRRLEEARAAAQATIRLDPDNGGAYAILGLAAALMDLDFDGWVELAARSYELAPNDPFVVFQYARAVENVGRAVEAEPIWRRAIQLDPLEQEPRYIFGYALSLWGRPDEGLQEIERIIESSPDDLEPRVYSYKGAALRTIGDLHGSTVAYLRAIDLDPNSANFKRSTLWNYLSLGDLENAKKWIDELGEASTARSLVLYLVESGQGEEALELALQELETRGAPHPLLVRIVVNDMIARGALGDAKEFLLRHGRGLSALQSAPIPQSLREFDRRFPFLLTVALQDVYKRLGDTAAADAVTARLTITGLEGMRGFRFESTAPDYYREALKHMREGRPADALTALERVVELGHLTFTFWQLDIRDNPVFEDISDEPRFAALIQSIESNMANQRAALAEQLAAEGRGTAPRN